jgi:hypothetical protein
MTRRIAAMVLTIAGSTMSLLPRTASAQRALTQSDSAAIVRAAWDVATDDFHTGRDAWVLWLWTPTADTARSVAFSPALRVALIMQGVPASTRRPAGDDTVVVRVTRWRTDAASVTIELQSAWTTLLGASAHRCRTGSGNIEHFRVDARGAEWIARRVGAVTHGDGGCRPLE